MFEKYLPNRAGQQFFVGIILTLMDGEFLGKKKTANKEDINQHTIFNFLEFLI